MFSTITHHDWRPRREWYTPGFKEHHVHTLFQSVNVCVNAFLEKLKPLADGTTTVSMKPHLQNVFTEVISKVCSMSHFLYFPLTLADITQEGWVSMSNYYFPLVAMVTRMFANSKYVLILSPLVAMVYYYCTTSCLIRYIQ